MYIVQIMYIRPTNTTVAMISWKHDGARFGPKESRVSLYTPENVINAVYAFVVLLRGAWWYPCVMPMDVHQVGEGLLLYRGIIHIVLDV